jgi:hypothetical protein
MSEKKTIQINPSLFEFNTKKTRQKKPKIEGGIKMKSSISKTPKNKSLKNGILKMIREKQQNDYQKLFSEKSTKGKPNKGISSNEIDNFKNDFQESIEYFNALEKEEPPSLNPPKNKTLKNYPSSTGSALQLQPQVATHPMHTNNGGMINTEYENVNLSLPNDFDSMPPIRLNPPNIKHSSYNYKPAVTQTQVGGKQDAPQWGCLRVGGKLPTYRTWKNATQKNRGENPNIMTNHDTIPASTSSASILPVAKPENESVVNLMKESQIERIKQKSTIKQMKTQMDNLNKPVKKQLKQRKIARRTYRIGKSKVLPKVSVLVSNRTLRNNITTKAQLLKQTPINEIKRFLIKRGFIKVGSNTPNDILRKMYESVSLICGEVQNHNSENLLYNYLHGGM